MTVQETLAEDPPRCGTCRRPVAVGVSRIGGWLVVTLPRRRFLDEMVTKEER